MHRPLTPRAERPIPISTIANSHLKTPSISFHSLPDVARLASYSLSPTSRFPCARPFLPHDLASNAAGPHKSGPRHRREELTVFSLYIATIRTLSIRFPFPVFPFVLAQSLSILQLPILPQTFTIECCHTLIILVVYMLRSRTLIKFRKISYL